MKQVEIFILAGWLGSGKTTLLQRLLVDEYRRKRKVAVLMNEFGSVSIDTTMLPTDVPTKELLKGCICCTLKDDLEVQLLSLIQEHAPDVIYVETTGVAHPLDVLEACMSPMMSNHITMKGIITILDAALFLQREEQSTNVHSLLLEQVKHADYLILNKASEISDADKAQIDWDISLLNRTAPLTFCDFADVELNKLSELANHAPRLRDELLHVKKLKAKSMIVPFSHSLDQIKWDAFLKHIPGNIWRMKGYITFSDQPEQRVLFQYAYRKFTYEKEAMKYPRQLVIIGEGIDVDALTEQLHSTMS
ncbi:MAG: CobW family GTP-binding protein [Bacilli bacterium]